MTHSTTARRVSAVFFSVLVGLSMVAIGFAAAPVAADAGDSSDDIRPENENATKAVNTTVPGLGTAIVFQGEAINFTGALDGPATVTGISGAADGQVIDLSRDIPTDQTTGTYSVDGTAINASDNGRANPGFTVLEPAITTAEVQQGDMDGSDISQVPSSSADNLFIVAEWNFGEAENLEVTVEDPTGVDITSQVLTNQGSNSDGAILKNGDGSSVGLDLADEDDGEYTVIFEGTDDLDYGGVIEEYTIMKSSGDQSPDSTSLDPSGDVDNDGLNNQDEFTHNTDFENPDTDSDGLSDGEEVNQFSTIPTVADTDSDGLSDGEEVNQFSTIPTVADTDSDDLIDGDEVNRHDTDPLEDDTDGDALLDGAEIDRYGTDPLNSDTDGDAINDGAEINNYDIDPTSPDTDGDGLGDEEELNQYGTDPTQRDTDSDGIGDDDEINSYDTDPTRPDSDNDGLDDGAEVNEHGTDPLITDTDGDGFDDRAEVRQGSDPTDGDDTPESSDQSASESEETSVEDSTVTQSDQDQSSADTSSESEEAISSGETGDNTADQGGAERGFFTNNPESGVGILQSPMSITMIGIILSILGIGLELRRGV